MYKTTDIIVTAALFIEDNDFTVDLNGAQGVFIFDDEVRDKVKEIKAGEYKVEPYSFQHAIRAVNRRIKILKGIRADVHAPNLREKTADELDAERAWLKSLNLSLPTLEQIVSARENPILPRQQVVQYDRFDYGGGQSAPTCEGTCKLVLTEAGWVDDDESELPAHIAVYHRVGDEFFCISRLNPGCELNHKFIWDYPDVMFDTGYAVATA
jgi:hypothetical protein